jgi:hypothetical protein
MIAAVPLLVPDPAAEWNRFSDSPYARSEFEIGMQFSRVHGENGLWFFRMARWACLPVSLLGAWACYCWGKELYGEKSGFIALVLYCFCPNIIAYAGLIVPDLGAAALGVFAGYRFWRWLREPAGWNMALAGISLGLAELTKSTWIILFALWGGLILFWELTRPGLTQADREALPSKGTNLSVHCCRGRWWQFAGILLLAVYMLNLGYGFERCFQRLDSFEFVSHAFGGDDAHSVPGNRFSGTWMGRLPVPVPANYLLGIDVQRADFEKGKSSYLRGDQKLGGWWYYYIYALIIKVPVGTWLLCSFATINTGLRFRVAGLRGVREDLVVLAPAAAVLILVSSQTGFNRYLRYVLPCLPFMFVWISQAGNWLNRQAHDDAPCKPAGQSNDGVVAAQAAQNRRGFVRRHVATLVVLCLVFSVVDSLAVWPHEMSYFNELAGGPQNGASHLLDANIDWGQDLLFFRRWYETHPRARPVYLSYFGFFDPRAIGLDLPAVPRQSPERLSRDETGSTPTLPSGWYALSINELYGYKHAGHETDDYSSFRGLAPSDYAGYSILIFNLNADDSGSK